MILTLEPGALTNGLWTQIRLPTLESEMYPIDCKSAYCRLSRESVIVPSCEPVDSKVMRLCM